MNFIPDKPPETEPAPYLEDVRESDGWEGHTTKKSIDSLLSEVTQALTRLGALMTGMISGTFQDEKARKRPGYVISYIYKTPDGRQMDGRIEVSGLPLRSNTPAKELQSRRMALYMLRESLNGSRYLQMLSPGYMALMPFMLADTGQTFSQKFQNTLLLAQPEDDSMEGN